MKHILHFVLTAVVIVALNLLMPLWPWDGSLLSSFLKGAGIGVALAIYRFGSNYIDEMP